MTTTTQNILTADVFNESIDKKLLERLLSHPELLTTWVDESGVEHDDKKQLINIYQNIKGGKLTVKYEFSKKSKSFGRVYAKGLLSLGACERHIRGTLTTGTYIDIDIVNAHPNMILHLLKQKRFQHSTYNSYCTDRDAQRQSIMDGFLCSKDEAKLFFITSGYGGKYETWYEGLAKKDHVQPNWAKVLFNKFREEAESLALYLIETNKDRYDNWLKSRRKKYNEKFGFLAIMIQDYERQILEEMYSFLEQEGIIKHKNAILCHDGIMIKSKGIQQDTLNRLQDHIKDQLEFNLTIVDKPLEHYMNKLEDKELVIAGEPIDLNYFKELKTYAEKKAYFERYVCKIINSSEFIMLSISLNDKGLKVFNHTIMTKINLITSFENYMSHSLFTSEDVEKKKDAPKPFIHKWLADEDMRHYLQKEFVMYNGTYKQDENAINFNMFTGYSTAIEGPEPSKDLMRKHLKNHLDVLRNLCEGTEPQLDFVLHYLAHCVQKPHVKLGLSLIATGSQGVGKDAVFVDSMASIFGYDFVNSDSNIDNFVGTHATGLLKQIIVVFNESEASASYGLEGIIKTLVTDKWLNVNEKYIKPYKCLNTARIIFLSNKSNPLRFDAVSKERRFYVVKATDKYAGRSKWWRKYFEHINDDPMFAICWYNYLNNIDLSNYNFEKIRKKTLTKSYFEMAQQQLPPAVEWLGDFVIKYNSTEEYHNTQKLEEGLVWKDYQKWQVKNRPDSSKDSGYVGTKKSFKLKIKELNSPFMFKRSSLAGATTCTYNNNTPVCEFNPEQVYAFLAHKNWIADCDLHEESEHEESMDFDLN